MPACEGAAPACFSGCCGGSLRASAEHGFQVFGTFRLLPGRAPLG